jgi:hypothetical protein
VNETKTDSELQRGYKKREIEGKLQCMKRLNSRKEYEIRNQIKELEEQLKVEKVVSDKIRVFIEKKRQIIQDKADEREKLKDAKLAELAEEKDQINQKKEAAEKETQDIT